MRREALNGRYATETAYLQIRGLKPTAMIKSLRDRGDGIAAHPTFNRAELLGSGLTVRWSTVRTGCAQ